jgi:hypothetical protein
MTIPAIIAPVASPQIAGKLQNATTSTTTQIMVSAISKRCRRRIASLPVFSIEKMQRFDIEAVEEQWRSQDAAFFKVLTAGGKYYLLQHEEGQD